MIPLYIQYTPNCWAAVADDFLYCRKLTSHFKEADVSILGW